MAGSAERGNRASRSCRRADLPEASARSTAVDASRALAPESCAAALSASRPDRPAASRVGSTTPGLSAVPVLSWPSRSSQVSCSRGQPTAAATGSGIATTTGLRAIEVSVGRREAGRGAAQAQQPGGRVGDPDVGRAERAAGLADTGQRDAVPTGDDGGHVDRVAVGHVDGDADAVRLRTAVDPRAGGGLDRRGDLGGGGDGQSRLAGTGRLGEPAIAVVGHRRRRRSAPAPPRRRLLPRTSCACGVYLARSPSC